MNQLKSFYSRFWSAAIVGAICLLTDHAMAGPTTSEAGGSSGKDGLRKEAVLQSAATANHAPEPVSLQLERAHKRGLKVRATKLLGNDPDGDALSLGSVDAASLRGGTVAARDGWVHYSPPAGMIEEDSFKYTVTDGRGGMRVNTVTIVMTNAPAVTAQALAVPTNDPVRMTGSGIPGRTYIIEFAEDAASPVWQTLETVVTDEFGAYSYTDHPPGGPNTRIYRARTH